MPDGAADIATLEMPIYSVGGGNIAYMEVENGLNDSAKGGGLTQVRALNLAMACSVFAFNKQIYIPDTLLIQLDFTLYPSYSRPSIHCKVQIPSLSLARRLHHFNHSQTPRYNFNSRIKASAACDASRHGRIARRRGSHPGVSINSAVTGKLTTVWNHCQLLMTKIEFNNR